MTTETGRLPTDRILVINCGSSSLKYKLYGAEVGSPQAAGIIEGIGADEGRHRHRDHSGETVVETGFEEYGSAVAGVVNALTRWGSPSALDDLSQIVGVGHRVVHGGDRFSQSTLIDAEVLQAVAGFDSLAPLHNPVNRAGIAAAQEVLPDAQGVAVFDTAFFATLPPRSYRYAIPDPWWRRHGVRRYGFHGISHRYLAGRAARLLGMARPNLVTLHLGNGASATAIRAGQAVDTSMGFTPLEGLVMGTRSGDVDPAVVFHLIEAGLTPAEIRRGLESQGGLLGLSGNTSDFRRLSTLARAGDPDARLAVEVFVHRIRRYLGAFLVQVGRCDGVVFSGGIGENSPEVRGRALEGLGHMGIALDPARNNGDGERRISTDDSPIPAWVIPTDEESLIARDTTQLIAD